MSATEGQAPLALAASSPRRARLRLLLLAGGLGTVALAIVLLLALDARELADVFEGLGALRAPALALAGTVLIVVLVPASLVTVACGYVLGTAAGLAVGLTACTLAAVAAVAIVRATGGADAAAALGVRAARAAAWVDDRPLRSVLVARLAPGTPFGVVSYALGLSRIGPGAIALGSLVGFAPRALVYTAVGGSLRDLDRPEARVALAASALLLLASLIAPRLRRRTRPNREET